MKSDRTRVIMKLLLVHNLRPVANYVMPELAVKLENRCENSKMISHSTGTPFHLEMESGESFDMAIVGVGD